MCEWGRVTFGEAALGFGEAGMRMLGRVGSWNLVPLPSEHYLVWTRRSPSLRLTNFCPLKEIAFQSEGFISKICILTEAVITLLFKKSNCFLS